MGGNQPRDTLAALSAAEIDAEVVRLKRTGMSFEAVGRELGFCRQVAQRRFQRAVTLIRATEVDKWREQQLAQIEAEREITLDILDAKHPYVSNGKRFDDLDDDGPRLSALAHLAKLRGQEQDILGLKAPTQSVVQATVAYTLNGVDPADLR